MDAAATQAAGTAGGSAAFVKNDIASSKFCPSFGELNSDAFPFRDIAAVILDLGPLRILLAYCNCIVGVALIPNIGIVQS